jgi:hypothetical protein
MHTYDKASGKGLNNFRQDPENGRWQADIVSSLDNKIVYHPILTISTSNASFIEAKLNEVLGEIDGLGNTKNGTPKLIIIPILVHNNHFATIAIAPRQKQARMGNVVSTDTPLARVFYFDPKGTEYAGEESTTIRTYLKARYNISQYPDSQEGDQVWQQDCSQCGPYSVWFA